MKAIRYYDRMPNPSRPPSSGDNFRIKRCPIRMDHTFYPFQILPRLLQDIKHDLLHLYSTGLGEHMLKPAISPLVSMRSLHFDPPEGQYGIALTIQRCVSPSVHLELPSPCAA